MVYYTLDFPADLVIVRFSENSPLHSSAIKEARREFVITWNDLISTSYFHLLVTTTCLLQ